MNILQISLSLKPTNKKCAEMINERLAAKRGREMYDSSTYSTTLADIGLSADEKPVPVFQWGELQDFVDSTCYKLVSSIRSRNNLMSSAHLRLVQSIMSILKHFCENDPDTKARFEETTIVAPGFKIVLDLNIETLSASPFSFGYPNTMGDSDQF